MKDKKQLRQVVKSNLDSTVALINHALQGKQLETLEPVLRRIGRHSAIPYWFASLQSDGTLPNLDGKTIGSVVEMLLVAVLETGTLATEAVTLRINPARGIDLPDLDLGVKSPSTNYCTSEPFFSAYERLLGSEYDVIVLVTDYQKSKKNPPLKLQITDWIYLEGSELADRTLCSIALKHRDQLLQHSEPRAMKLFKFLAYVNQSNWLGNQLLMALSLLNANPSDTHRVNDFIKEAEASFIRQNRGRQNGARPLIPDEDIAVIRSLMDVSHLELAIIEAVDNWVLSTFQEAGRSPNSNELARLKVSPLNGKIGVSPALQWRYNFSPLFKSAFQDDRDGEP